MHNETENIAPIELLAKYFAGEASHAEIIQTEEWRDSSAENLNEFEAIKKLWNYTESPVFKEQINIDTEWTKMEHSIQPVRTRTLNFSKMLAIAASIAVLTTLSFFGYQLTQVQTFKTGTAEVKEIKMPDGSVINLNANTKLTYKKSFGKKHRNLSLKGEAYFDVSKNNELPFVIRAAETKVQVVGTQFNVKAYKKLNEVKVTVTEGTVKLFDSKMPEKTTLIHAGETGSFKRKTKAIEKIPGSDINDVAWKTKTIKFDNTPLDEVALVLSNTYHVNIEIQEKIKSCTIDVSFENQDFVEVMKVIKSTLNINAKVEGNKLILSGEGC